MRKYPVEEFDIMFKDFDGIGELIEAVCEIEKSNRSNLIVALTNHIRTMMEETRVLGLSIGTVTTTGEKFARVSVFDIESSGITYEFLRDASGSNYIVIE